MVKVETSRDIDNIIKETHRLVDSEQAGGGLSGRESDSGIADDGPSNQESDSGRADDGPSGHDSSAKTVVLAEVEVRRQLLLRRASSSACAVDIGRRQEL